jgi:hypothetical protein
MSPIGSNAMTTCCFATAILHNEALFATIVSFQDGCALDLRVYYRSWLNICDFPVLGSCSSFNNTEWQWAKFFNNELLRDTNRLERVQRLFRYFPGMFTISVMDMAASFGFLDLLQYLHAQGHLRCSKAALNDAATNGHYNVVVFLHEYGSSGCTVRAMNGAAENGHLEIVRYLHTHRTEGCTTSAMDGAAANGYLDIVTFLHMERQEGCTTNAMDNAAQHGHLHVVDFLHRHRSEGCTTDRTGRCVGPLTCPGGSLFAHKSPRRLLGTCITDGSV